MIEQELYISLSNDLMFKHILGTEENKKFTIDFMSALLDLKDDELKTLEITNSIKLTKEVVENKQFEVDGVPRCV